MVTPTEARARDMIKIGVLGPWESSPGKGIRLAAEMAAEEINSQGGILGKQTELLFSDTELKSDLGKYGYAKLVEQDKAVAVIGTASSEVALAVMEQMAHYKVPFLPTGAASPEITDKVAQAYDKYRHLFRIFMSSDEMADSISDLVINGLAGKHHIKNVALITESAVWTTPIVRKWEKTFKQAGITILISEYFYRNTKDFKPVLSKITENKADAICMLSSHADMTAYITQWADIRGPIMIGTTISPSAIWESSEGKILSMVEMICPGILGLTSKSSPFCKKYIKKYKTRPETTSPYTYDAMYILKAAIEKAKSTEPDALAEALEQTDYEGVGGRWVFDKKSHHSKFGPGYRQMLMAQWQMPGKLCVIWPENMKTCDFVLPPWYEKE